MKIILAAAAGAALLSQPPTQSTTLPSTKFCAEADFRLTPDADSTYAQLHATFESQWQEILQAIHENCPWVLKDEKP